jgi:glucose-1-phosphate adenylyltransferase
MGQTIAFLLAGGEGARLYPLTRDRSKPAVPFGGAWRLIDFTLSNCLHSGLHRIFVLTQYKSESLTRHIYNAWHFFRPTLGETINILPPQLRQTRDFYRGTADAVYQNMYTILREAPRDVVVVSGDHIYAMDYQPFVAYHHERDADLTIATFPVPRAEAHRFGVLTGERDGRVNAFQEKPKELSRIFASEEGTVNASMGVYVFKTAALVRELEEGPALGRRFDFGKDIIPGMVGRDRVFLYPFRKGAAGHRPYWRDVGTLDSYFQASLDLLGPQPLFDPRNPEWPIIHAPDQVGPACFGCSLSTGVRNAIIGGGCRIDGEVTDSVIFNNVTVETGAHIDHAVLMSGVHIEANVVIRNALLDKGVRVSRGTVIGGRPGPLAAQCGRKVVYTPAGIAVVPKGEVVCPERRVPLPVLDRVRLDSEIEAAVPAEPPPAPSPVLDFASLPNERV